MPPKNKYFGVFVFYSFCLFIYLFVWNYIPLPMHSLIIRIMVAFFILSALNHYYEIKHKTLKDILFLGIILMLPP